MKTKLSFLIFFIVTCYAGYAQVPNVYTMGHDTLGSNNYNLYGAINAHGDNAAFSFVYSTDSTFATSTTSPVQNKVINSIQVVWATINGLSANTKYYYYLTATTSHGTATGDHMTFFSNNTRFAFENTGADVYGPGYAELNGKIKGAQTSAALSFEFGLTPDMGMTTTSNYPIVSDTNNHEFRGYPSPLTAGTLYFYRVKAVTASDTLYTDIKAFFMGNPFTSFQALPSTNITTTSADINAQATGFHVPVKMKSEINGGLINHQHTPLVYFDTTISTINYTYHAPNLQPNTSYTVRIKAYTWIGSYYVDGAVTTLSAPMPPDVYTMGHDTLGSHNFNLYGAINAHGDNAAFSFVYSTDSTFATSTTTPVQNKVINSLQVVWATVNGLAANTKYFYYLTATTPNGTATGDHMSFYTELLPFVFENTGADVYGPGYAELNGTVSGFQVTADLSFEYGLTPDMGLTATSNYPTVSDANTHGFRAYPSSLTPGALFFYRVKAVTATDTLYTDIKAFYMGNPFSLFQPLPASNITLTSADIHAQAQGFHVPIKMKSEITGGIISHLHTPLVYFDTTASVINYSYSASNLQENTNYNVRIKAYTWVGSFYVETAFTTLSSGPQPEVYTMGHDTLGSHNFNLYGAINAHGDTAAYSFVYSTDPTFATSTASPVQNKVIDSIQVVWATINGLAANTTYYYYLTANTSHGTGYGKHMSFYTEDTPFAFENMGADVYSPTGAELNGKVKGFSYNADLSFEYGLTPAMGMTVASNFPTVSDQNSHEFRGYPGSLTPGALYFFRVKAAGATDTIYTDIKAFYMGYPYSLFLALPATNVTSSSADIHAQVQGFKVPVKMKSEINGGSISHGHTPYVYYDTTSSVINYTYSASGLDANTHFTVRIKAYTWIGSYYVDSAFTTLSTGVAENIVNDVYIYPVPASNYLTVEMNNKFDSESTIQLYNINGQLVKELRVPANQQTIQINVTNFEDGIYLLKLVSGNTVLNKNVIVLK